MENYAILSLETHLFFARIMKEHSFFLEAGFPCAEEECIKKADWYREQFEDLLRDVVELSDERVNQAILDSGEIVTEFTIPAERSTEQLSGVAIDSRISQKQQKLNGGFRVRDWREVNRAVHELNQRSLKLVEGLIDFKEHIIEEVCHGRLFNTNYPLLVQHILREAKLYRATIQELMEGRELTYKNLRKTEEFWNRIMMEHALFIRGLLDPCENELIAGANDFAREYKELLQKAREQDCRAARLTEKSLETTRRYQDFKAAGTKGILECEIASIILPLLADHVLREANHYIRLLETED